MKRVVEFFGGEEGLSAVKAVQERLTERHFTSNNQPVLKADTVRIVEFPDKVQFKLVGSNITKTLGPNGAFAVNLGKFFDLSSQQGEMSDDVKREIINIAQHVNDPKYVFRLVGTKRVGKITATLIDIDADGAKTQWAIDPDSGKLLLATEKFNDSLLAGSVQQTVYYSAYRKFGTLNLPVNAEVYQEFTHAYSDALERRSGRQGGSVGVNFYGNSEFTIEKINPAIPKGTFDRPTK